MEETLLQKLESKFTKANMHAVLEELNEQQGGSEELEAIIAVVKPQKGGGASANPPKEIDGVTFHYCRFKDDYVPESEINMSGGKSKGTSILASKVAYRIGKAADELKDKAMKCFVDGQYEDGAKLNAEQAEIRALIEDKATFTDEAMAVSIYHPDFGKEVKKDSILDTDTDSANADEKLI